MGLCLVKHRDNFTFYLFTIQTEATPVSGYTSLESGRTVIYVIVNTAQLRKVFRKLFILPQPASISLLSWNSHIHYRVHKDLLLDPIRPFSLRFFILLMSPSHLRLRLLSDHFSEAFPTKFRMHFSLFHVLLLLLILEECVCVCISLKLEVMHL